MVGIGFDVINSHSVSWILSYMYLDGMPCVCPSIIVKSVALHPFTHSLTLAVHPSCMIV